jgi:SAM-dependent MidA family methyltransferase
MTLLASKIYNEIQKTGPVPFAKFMEMALYFPELGYYERPERIGQRGDFYTSASVGELFGQLLAFQFVQWLEEQNATAPREQRNLQLIEAGAHDGRLAADVLDWFRHFCPEIFERLEYRILEPSPRRREWQQKTLADFAGKVFWFADWPEYKQSVSRQLNFTVCFFNELFDAMPVHRLGWDANKKTWFEWGVDCEGENFFWKRLSETERSPIAFPQLAPELLDVLPDGFATETCPAAPAWWIQAGSVLDFGKLLAIDYGLLAEDFFTPQRSNGTLRAYSRHHANANLLENPGEQDITAHVNFTELKKAGEIAGWKTEDLISQSKFLTQIAANTMSHPESFGEWDAKRAKQLQTLTHPEHLGRSFRVLIQSR